MVDTKQAEKDYLRRAATADWELSKPFAAPGVRVKAEDAADLIHDFAAMLRMLAPRPDDLVLDLGSGGCWISDWLARLDMRPVSVDIAFDMLKLGRSRLPPGKSAGLVVSDMEALPFANGSFHHACCMNAIHHVPAIPAALKEICRVLRPDGRAAFLEPGSTHSSTESAQAAMRDFGVLEQDIVVSDFMQQCTDAGFAHVQVLPLAYTVTGLSMTRDKWDNWRRYSQTKRPRRAAKKLWLAALELFGIGKETVLTEDAFSIHLARTVGQWVEAHPMFLAYRSDPNLPQPLDYASTIQVLSAPEAARAGETVRVRIKTQNAGTHRWRASLNRVTPTRAGIQLLKVDGTVAERDFARAPLPQDITPGSECEVMIEFAAPPAGSYQLKIDMVVEGLKWFGTDGSPVVTIPLRVT